MPQIILKERTVHLASCTFLTRDVDQYKNTSLSQLYQPPKTPISQNTYHQLLSPCEYCKVFKNSFLQNTPKGSHLQCSSKQMFLNVSPSSQQSTCVGISFKKTCKLKACNIIQKKTSNRYFPVKFAKFLRTPFSAPPVAASIFLKKSN